MLCVRYVEDGKETSYEFPDNHVEQIVPRDIFELLGEYGIVIEMLKNINIFQSSSEFVDTMSITLCEHEAEIYLQDEFDEFDGDDSNDCYVVFNAVNVSKLLRTDYKETYVAIYKVAKFIMWYISYLADVLDTLHPTDILYFICIAISIVDDFNEENLTSIMTLYDYLMSEYYSEPQKVADTESDIWRKQLKDLFNEA